jgi:hypothetical protein
MSVSIITLRKGTSMTRTLRLLCASAASGLLLASGLLIPAEAHTTGIHDNCTNFNKRFPHGVGTRHAVDRGGDVTNFRRSNRIYWRAERHNTDLDRDNDRIACEKA